MIPTKWNPLGAAFLIEDVSAFQIRITEDDIADATNYHAFFISTNGCSIFWGDGSTEVLSNSTAVRTHAYGAAGTYLIRIKGNHWFYHGSGTTASKVVKAFRFYSGMTYGRLAFLSCSNLRLAAGFRPAESMTRCDFMLDNCNLDALPSGFRFPASTIDLYEALRGNPNMVFDISHLFPDWPSGSTVDLTRICYNDANLTGAAPASKLWERTDITWISAGAFAGCTGLSNYADIPAGWK